MRVDQVINEAVNGYASERRAYLEADDDGRHSVRMAASLASILLEPSDHLTTSRSLETWSLVRELVDGIDPADPTYEALELLIAERFLPVVADMASRCLELTRLPLRHEPNQAVRDFLKRVAQCYIFGFVPECAVMCRATVENAITERFAIADLPLPATPQGKSPLRSRLAAGVKFRLFSQVTSDKAWIVWTRGSKTAHDDAHLLQTARDTVNLTVEVLDELYSSPPR